ncbi:MAG: SRPBCC domain-containing protein [Sphingobacteriales bacterium]|nr:SRPBCC domain-containing protein [Sphingobacteriales bacterium]
MIAKKESKEPVAGREINITRLVNAPRDLVWEVWTNPEHIRHWWGPNGFYSTIFEMDVRPGGNWEFILHGPDGRNYKNKCVYAIVQKPEKLVYDHVSGPVFRFTALFTEQGDQTQITIQLLFESTDLRDKVVKEFNAVEGLLQNVDKLKTYLAYGYAADELVFTRIIRAPRELVFKAWTDPRLLSKWWGPSGFTNPVCEIETVPHGRIYIDMKSPDGTVYPMSGEVLEIIPPKKLVFTSVALGPQQQHLLEVRNTLTLEETDGNTRLSLQVKVSGLQPEGKQHLKGMNEGWSQGLERLINLVE